MKRILSVIFIFSMLAGIFAFPASAKSVQDVVDGVTKEQVILDDMYILCEAVDENDAAEIFRTVLVVYPDLVATIKKNMNDDHAASAPSGSITAGDERCVYAVTELIKNRVFLDDLAKLTNTVSEGESGKIFDCILEIYPDIVAALKKALAEYPGNDEVPFAVGGAMDDKEEEKGNGADTVLWAVCAGVVGIAVGAVTVYVVMKKKKVTVPEKDNR